MMLLLAALAQAAPVLDFQDNFDALTASYSGTGGWAAQWSGDNWAGVLGTAGPITNSAPSTGFGSGSSADNHLVQTGKTYGAFDATLRFATTDNDTVGFTFGYQDTRNFFLVHITCGCGSSSAPGVTGTDAGLSAGVRLYRVVNGTALELGRREGPTYARTSSWLATPSWNWIRVRREASGRIQVWFDSAGENANSGTLMFEANDTTHANGRLGLYSYSTDVRFDWLRVHLDDTDGDGVPDVRDNCPTTSNASQANLDNDSLGDACDPDQDGDGSNAPADCNDRDPQIRPGTAERCDGLDNDCDGQTDEDPPAPNGEVFWPDADGDGAGTAAGGRRACSAPPGHVNNRDDCDDTDPERAPGKPEVCDGKDNDCDGQVDDVPPGSGLPQWWPDADGDGVGATSGARSACTPPSGFVATTGDCADNDPARAPGKPEVCDGKDNDCDGQIDEDPTNGQPHFLDADSDGYGAGEPVTRCGETSDYVATDGDCDDGDPNTYPGAPEAPGDGIDQDCDGEDVPGEPPRPFDPSATDTAALEDHAPAGCRCASGGAPPRGILLVLGSLALLRRRSIRNPTRGGTQWPILKRAPSSSKT